LKQIAMGFRELHRHKVMHRDFKLDNLFMNDDTVVIADLGFAKAGREMTQTQCGTPLYMAPEIFAGKKYTN
jgi:serine/threonine protein kinase